MIKFLKQPRPNQNVASNYLRGIDHQLHGTDNNMPRAVIERNVIASGSSRNKSNPFVPSVTKQRTLAPGKTGKLVNGSVDLRKSQN